MKRLIGALIIVGCAASSLLCRGEAVCQKLVVRSQVEAAPGELSLADLLAPGMCPQWYRWAAQISLGAVPRAGGVRVLEGDEIRRLIHGSGDRGEKISADDRLRIPERVVIRRARAVKSCAEIARVVSQADPALSEPGRGRGLKEKDLDCAAARNIPEDASLELVKAKWNAGLQRREFALRCGRPEDCIPFLVWEPADTAAASAQSFLLKTSDGSTPGQNEALPLIKAGQTVMLTWDEAGIRVIMPVTCMEAGGLGQRVRVRFKNAPRTLRAEIVGVGMVRASL
jgi:hypothetical protein